jgi:alpha-1,4-N-acetylglucosaminyltransferase EXTL3
MKFSYFFPLLWVIFGLLDPDSGFGYGSTDLIQSGSNPDQDSGSETLPSTSLGPGSATLSPAFRRNFSTALLLADEAWNTHMSPFRLPPHTPWEPLLPTEAKFLGAGVGFRPICGGR